VIHAAHTSLNDFTYRGKRYQGLPDERCRSTDNIVATNHLAGTHATRTVFITTHIPPFRLSPWP
jgi:hypothetical protein